MSTYPSSTGNNPTRGVYFLADDHMVDLVIAFLNSFRRYNPDLPLCMIPFNNNTARLECLQPRFRFSMYPYPQLCEACDVISKQFFPRVVGHFRKLAAWEGNFDKFIYIDIDNLVLRDVSSVYRHLQAYDIVTCDSNVKFNVRWVWKDSIYSSGLLTVSQIEYAANTSFIASKKGTLSIADILANLRAWNEITFRT